jgi:hypothetical protein
MPAGCRRAHVCASRGQHSASRHPLALETRSVSSVRGRAIRSTLAT